MKTSVHVALTTGVATGIGLALAKKFFAHGNQVILVGCNDLGVTAHRGQGGLKPDKLAEEFWQGFTRERYEMVIELTKFLRLIERISPALAEKMIRHRV